MKERGTYRQKWDMPHDLKTDYHRKDKYSKYDEDYNEDEEDLKIYCDMDGVLCNFFEPAFKRVEIALHNPEKYQKQQKTIQKILQQNNVEKISPEMVMYSYYGKINNKNKLFVDLFYSLLRNDKNFWSNLEWKEGGKELWEHIKQYNPIILSAPLHDDQQCKEGKKEWVHKNLCFKKTRK